MTTIAEYRSSKELFLNLTLRELRSKYKRSFLGWTWSLVNPLANMVVYSVIFAYLLRITFPAGHPSGLHKYALLLLCAMLPWNFFQNSVMGSMGSLTGNSNLIKKTYFPRELLPAANVASGLVSHLIELGLLVVVMLGFGNWRAAVDIPYVLVLVAVVTCLAIGIGLIFSILNVYFRDIEHFIGILFLIWFYGTPVVYPFTLVPAHLRLLWKINPMTDAVLCFRSALFDGTRPALLEFGYLVVFAAVALIAGLALFNKLEGRLAEEL
ncbi:MAG: ABC transporter permease [Actinomycetota bacterium]|nr:ABC transporter permease [Actinomycetota bacterium]